MECKDCKEACVGKTPCKSCTEGVDKLRIAKIVATTIVLGLLFVWIGVVV